MPRWRWTLDELDRLIDAGVLGEDDRVELLGGELVPLAAKGNKHENLKAELINAIFPQLPKGVRLTVEHGWRAAPEMYLEPDVVIYPAGRPAAEQRPGDVLLVLEVSDSSLRYDLDRKSKIYAALGVREYWVVNAVTLETRVHREPSGESYGTVSDHAKDETLQPSLLPALSVCLGTLKVE